MLNAYCATNNLLTKWDILYGQYCHKFWSIYAYFDSLSGFSDTTPMFIECFKLCLSSIIGFLSCLLIFALCFNHENLKNNLMQKLTSHDEECSIILGFKFFEVKANNHSINMYVSLQVLICFGCSLGL